MYTVPPRSLPHVEMLLGARRVLVGVEGRRCSVFTVHLSRSASTAGKMSSVCYNSHAQIMQGYLEVRIILESIVLCILCSVLFLFVCMCLTV